MSRMTVQQKIQTLNLKPEEKNKKELNDYRKTKISGMYIYI